MKKLLKGGNVIVWAIITIMGGYVLFRGVALAASSNDSADIVSGLDYSLNQRALKVYMPGLVYPVEAEAEQDSIGEFIVKKAFGIVPVGIYIQESGGHETEVESMSTYEMILASEANDENEVDETGKLVAGEEDIANMEEENAQAAHTEPIEDISIDRLRDYDYLINTFYQVDKTTTINSAQLNVDDLLNRNMAMAADNSQPQILIYHTHSQEAFKDSTDGDPGTSIVGVGEYLTELLRDKYGYNVIHHTGVYDIVGGKLDRNQAYTLAGQGVQQILDENPSIEVVIDLHRDGVNENTHLISEVNGKQMAPFMFFNGLSRTTKNGDIAYLANQYINDNLAFSLQLQLKAAQYHPGSTRKIYLKGYRYNLHFRPKSLLVECGAQTNTVEEVRNSMEPLADVLDKVLKGQ